MGAMAFGERLQSLPKQPGRAGAKGINTPVYPLPSVSCRPSHWMTPVNPREQGSRRCCLRRVASWGTELDEEGESGSDGANGDYPARRENLQVMKNSFAVHSIPVFIRRVNWCTSCVRISLLVHWPLNQMSWKGTSCRCVLFGSHSIFLNQPTPKNLYCL